MKRKKGITGSCQVQNPLATRLQIKGRTPKRTWLYLESTCLRGSTRVGICSVCKLMVVGIV